MNSLEFIEKEIEDRKENIKHWEKQLEHYSNSDVFTRCINMCNEQLQVLEQIKSELETLYILHDKLEFSVIKIDTEEGTKYYLGIKDYNSLIAKEEAEIVNKALEINYESEE